MGTRLPQLQKRLGDKGKPSDPQLPGPSRRSRYEISHRLIGYDIGVSKVLVWLWLVMMVGGCVEIPRGFDSPEPAARMQAAVDAAARNDRSAIPKIISLLDSDDPATRMVAIRSLERLTGQTLGYDHAAPETQRAQAIQRWVDWANQNADSFTKTTANE